MSFKDSVAEVKRAYDIVTYIQGSGVNLRSSGINKFKGLCPFHSEKTPSFVVDSRFQNFRCFGCGEHGDLLAFVEKTENLSFTDALIKLADDKGIEIALGDREDNVDYRSLRECVKQAALFYRKSFRSLDESHAAFKEITSRGLSVKGSVVYGYAPNGGDRLVKHLQGKGFSDEIIIQSGVALKSSSGRLYDFWRGRLMFFITDITGRPIGFSGRKLYENDKMGKYVNSPDTPLFNKSSVLYNASRARENAAKDSCIYVTEGQFDVAALVESGLPAVVASLGTSFTEGHANLCRRMVSDKGRIVFCFDGDDAGVSAAVKVFRHAPVIHSQSYVVVFPDGMDPCEFMISNGKKSLREYIENNQVPMVEFVLESFLKDLDVNNPTEKSEFIDRAASVLKTVSSYSFRESMISKVSLNTFLPVDTVRQAVEKAKPIDIDSFKGSSVESHDKNSFKDRNYDDVTDIDQGAVVKNIEENLLYSAIARGSALCIMEPRFIPSFVKMRALFPNDMKWVADDLAKMSGRKKIVAEDFSCTRVMDYIMSSVFFPLSGIMDYGDYQSLYSQLSKYIVSCSETRNKESRRRKIVKVLSGSKGDIDMLDKAVRKDLAVQ